MADGAPALPPGFRLVSPGTAPPAPPPGFVVQPRAAAAAPVIPPDPDEVVKRGILLPIGTTRGGETVPATPEVVKVMQDAFHHGVGVAMRIMSGEVTEPKQLTPEDYYALGSLATMGSLTSFRLGGLKPAAAAVSDVTAAGQRLGIDVPRGAVSTGVASQTATRVTNAVPIGGAPLRSASKSALEDLKAAAAGVKSDLGGGSVYAAGQNIEQGLTAFAGPKGALSQRVSEAYNKVDAFVDPAATGDLTATMALVQKATNAAAAAGVPPGKVVETVTEAATRPGGLTYEGIKTLRTKIGEWVDDKPLAATAGVSAKEAEAAYAALSADLRNIVEKAGGKEGLAAWEAANASAAAAGEVRTALSKILKTGNEGEGALFTRLVGMAGSGARADIDTLALAREAVGDKNWSEVLSAMVEKWGFDQEGTFSPQMFVQQWGKVTPEAKAVLFKTAAEQKQVAALDDIAKVSTVAARLRTLSAPPPAMITGALGMSGTAAAIGAMSPQNFGVVATSVLGARVISNVLAKPEGAAAFAQWARAWEGFAAKPVEGTAGALGSAANKLAALVALDQGLDPKSAVYLRNYLQGAPIGQPLAVPKVPAPPPNPNQLRA